MTDSTRIHSIPASTTFASLRPYARYKPTNSPWLDNVPEHWGVRNLRTLVKRRNERNHPELPLLSVARERGVFVRSLDSPDDNYNAIPDDLSNYKVARRGNLVINKMKAWQGSMGIAPCDGIVSPAYFVFNLNIHSPTYGQALLRSKPYIGHFARASDGVRIGQWDLSIAGMREIPVVLPSDDEQELIARFIGFASRRIDKAIHAKRRVITLLLEQKRTIIQQAVTRGIQRGFPRKESNIPGLGEIPSHWNVSRLKFEASDIVDCLHATPHYSEDGEFAAIRTADIEPGKVRLSQALKLSHSEFKRWIVRLVPRAGISSIAARASDLGSQRSCLPMPSFASPSE